MEGCYSACCRFFCCLPIEDNENDLLDPPPPYEDLFHPTSSAEADESSHDSDGGDSEEIVEVCQNGPAPPPYETCESSDADEASSTQRPSSAHNPESESLTQKKDMSGARVKKTTKIHGHGGVVERLTNPSNYTGSHKARLEGRRDTSAFRMCCSPPRPPWRG